MDHLVEEVAKKMCEAQGLDSKHSTTVELEGSKVRRFYWELNIEAATTALAAVKQVLAEVIKNGDK